MAEQHSMDPFVSQFERVVDSPQGTTFDNQIIDISALEGSFPPIHPL
jgi:hypothetical protein